MSGHFQSEIIIFQGQFSVISAFSIENSWKTQVAFHSYILRELLLQGGAQRMRDTTLRKT